MDAVFRRAAFVLVSAIRNGLGGCATLRRSTLRLASIAPCKGGFAHQPPKRVSIRVTRGIPGVECAKIGQ